jgi:putative transposase
VVDKAITAHGVPQRLLSDNGLALNPSRRGYIGQLVGHVGALGAEAITGKPYKPTTQGKNERFHQTLFRYLDKQPLANTLTELQAQVDAFDHVYNTERPHQGLSGRVTPLTAWQATEKAEAPRPKPDPPFLTRPAAPRRPPAPPAPPAPPTTVPDGTIVRRLTSQGTFRLDKVTYLVGGQHGFHHVLIDIDGDTITVINREGEILAEHTRPAPGITYVGNGRPRGPRPKTAKPSPKS